MIITKTLRAEYKDPTKIAHKVLADRMAARDPGNKPMANDRIPFVYIRPPPHVEIKLQGDRIEHPDFIKETNLQPDYRFYIKNQLVNPICQLYALCIEQLPGYSYSPGYWMQIDAELMEKELYQDDKKRKDRIVALRTKEAEALLFHEFTNQLEEVKKAKKLQEQQQLSNNMYTIEVSVEDQKADKRYECQIKITDKDGTNVNTITEAIVKRHRITTKHYCIRFMLEKVFKECDPVMLSSGITFVIDDKVFVRTWKTAISRYSERKAAIDEAIKTQDIGAFKELQAECVFDNLVRVLDKYPYSIVTMK